MSSDRSSLVTVLGANFSAGFVAGCLAGASTCPLDVAKTRRQIEVLLNYKSLQCWLVHHYLLTSVVALTYGIHIM